MKHMQRFTLEKIAQRLALIEPWVYQNRQPLSAFRYQKLAGPETLPPVGPDIDDSHWPEIPPNSGWGEPEVDFVLRTHFTLPVQAGGGAGPLALYLPLGDAGSFSHPEALAYVDGVPFAACDRHHQEILLREEWADGQPHLLALHGWTGIGGGVTVASQAPAPQAQLCMRPCELVQIHQVLRDFVSLARVAWGTAASLEADNPVKHQLLNALDAAFQILDTHAPLGDSLYTSVPEALKVLQEGIAQAGPPHSARVHSAGHAHIDVAWLWTLGQTRRKAGRTFHNVLRFMEQFPDYQFTQSQPQLYEYVRQDYPDLFEGIRTRVAEGRWEPIGGMWVEADCNLTGSESLARQFFLGRGFFRKHFGPEAESPVLWLPDVFGYAWTLPQLINEAGLEYFFTIKIGWSQYNRLPYDSFWWQGLDGTRVLTHFSTTPVGAGWKSSTYNAKATPEDVLGTWTNYKQKELPPDLLMAYGYGDGGGGPTREMLENIEPMKAFPGLPQVRQSSVHEFFQALETAEADLPTWNGELYLEYHRGTYTTQARSKRANRKAEFALHDAEFLAVTAGQLADYPYPHADLKRAWELVCLNQFHDIIPGSSIGPVYAESLEQYREVMSIAGEIRVNALTALAPAIGGDRLIVNPAAVKRAGPVHLPGTTTDGRAPTIGGRGLPAQMVEGGILLDCGELPPYSITRLDFVPTQAAQPSKPRFGPVTASETHLENQFIRAEFSPAGDLVRVYDKTAQREVLASGAVGNQFQAFEDRPLNWDAWDIDIFYDDKMWLAEPAVSVRVLEAGPLRATVEIRRRILGSEFIQRISLSHSSPELRFDTGIDWQERHILLKVAFPVEIHAQQATYEIQWGNVQRPTHRNTSWDWARFESCAQKWVDLSEGDYGVSLLNDCKYGHDIQDQVMRITLLRSPTHPDPDADRGEHRFTYSLFPHTGGWNERTIAAAYALNDPLIVWEVGGAGDDQPAGSPGKISWFAVDHPNLLIETIKAAEDGEGIVLRLYESQRRRGSALLTTAFPIRAAWETNLLEEKGGVLAPEGNTLRLDYRPYQILTVLIAPE